MMLFFLNGLITNGWGTQPWAAELFRILEIGSLFVLNVNFTDRTVKCENIYVHWYVAEHVAHHDFTSQLKHEYCKDKCLVVFLDSVLKTDVFNILL